MGTRSQNNAVVDATVGYPEFVLDALLPQLDPVTVNVREFDHRYNNGRSLPELKEMILKLHQAQGHLWLQKKPYIVVTDGATAALDLVMRLAHQPIVSTPAPHWSRLGVITRAAGKIFLPHHRELILSGADDKGPVLELFTSPNNPDGRLNRGFQAYDNNSQAVFDMTYNWTTYLNEGEKVQPISEDSIFSFAKLTGMCSTRVGWIATYNPHRAKAYEELIETTQSGVSGISQHVAAAVLKILAQDSTILKKFAETLRQRRSELELALVGTGMSDLSHQGMFAWLDGGNTCEDVVQRLAKVGIQALDGQMFGGSGQNARLSLGMNQNDFEKMIKRIKIIKKKT